MPLLRGLCNNLNKLKDTVKTWPVLEVRTRFTTLKVNLTKGGTVMLSTFTKPSLATLVAASFGAVAGDYDKNDERGMRTSAAY